MSDKDRDSGFDAALRGALGSLTAAGSAACPDENRLAAYLERRLAPAQLEAIEAHASQCVSCQETLALALELELREEPRLEEPASLRPERRVLFRFSFPLATLGLLMVAVGIGVVLMRGVRRSGPQSEIAQLERPAAPSADSARPEEPPAREADLDRKQESRAVDRVRPAGVVTRPGRADDLGLGARSREQATPAASPIPAAAPAAAAEVSKAESERALADAAPRDEQRKSKDGEQAELLRPAAIAGTAGGVAGGKLPEAKAAMSAAPTPRQAIEGFAQLWAAQPAANAFALRNVGKSGQLSNRGPLVAQNQNAAPQNAGQTTRPDTQNAVQKSAPPLPPSRLVGDRTFYLYMGYWVDERTASTPDAELVRADAAVREEIRAALPGILDLRASGAGSPAETILVWWKDKIYAVR